MNLTAEKIRFAYGGVPVIDDLSAEIVPGEVIAVVGPNGSGKTTLLKLLGGLLTPVAGTIRMNGADLTDLHPREIAKAIAWIPQETDIGFGYSVLDIVLMGRAPHLGGAWFEKAGDLDIARRAMDRTEVTPLAGRPIDAISGGERQRVLLARALAQETPILLLDEPTAFLDLKYQTAIYDLLERLAHVEGKAVVTVTHDLNLASLYADEMVLLKGGEIFTSGRPDEVLREDILETIYGTCVHVDRHPDRDRPRVSLKAGAAR